MNADGWRYYEVLGVERDANQERIKKAFRAIARTCHPDVSGDDAGAAATFKAAREAYETLIDEASRKAYDRAHEPRPRRGRAVEEDRGAFFRAFYRRASGGAPEPKAKREKTHGGRFRARDGSIPPRAETPSAADMFSDFGFGAGSSDSGARPRVGGRRGDQIPKRGDDVVIDLSIPSSVARDGGVVDAHYARLVRIEGASNGSAGVRANRGAEQIDVPAGTRQASVRRYRGLGDAGAWGGPFGDLVVRFRIPEDPPVPPPSRPSRAQTSAPPSSDGSESAGVQIVGVSIAEALLGGRIEVQTPGGRVRVSLPPCSSSGRRLRLSGRGEEGSDLYLEIRIVAPPQLDERSRALIEEFAALNPESPSR